MRGYIDKLRAGEAIERPLEAIKAESERVFAEYRALLGPTTPRPSTSMRELARTVYPFVENHNFYVEHWHHSIFWNRVREIGQILVNGGFLEDAEDVFYLHRFELHDALYDLCTGWATGTPARGPSYWPPEIAERKRIMHELQAWVPPPALGTPPQEVTEPFTVMLFGRHHRHRQHVAGAGTTTRTALCTASPRARHRRGRRARDHHRRRPRRRADRRDPRLPDHRAELGPVFAKIGGAVSDIGGIMSHAAIVSREYGLPAVVGTGFGTKRIETGQRIRVDGNEGAVTVLDGAG